MSVVASGGESCLACITSFRVWPIYTTKPNLNGIQTRSSHLNIRRPYASRSIINENVMADFLAEMDDELGIRHPVYYYASNYCNGSADTANHAAGLVPDISNPLVENRI